MGDIIVGEGICPIQELVSVMLGCVSKNLLCQRWHFFSVNLDINIVDVTCGTSQNHYNIFFEILHLWKARMGTKAKLSIIVELLEKMELISIAENIKRTYYPSFEEDFKEGTSDTSFGSQSKHGYKKIPDTSVESSLVKPPHSRGTPVVVDRLNVGQDPEKEVECTIGVKAPKRMVLLTLALFLLVLLAMCAIVALFQSEKAKHKYNYHNQVLATNEKVSVEALKNSLRKVGHSEVNSTQVSLNPSRVPQVRSSLGQVQEKENATGVSGFIGNSKSHKLVAVSGAQ